MLSDAPLTTILPVVDLPRARAFYEQKLGLGRGRAKLDGKYEYPVGNGALALFQRGSPTKADHTAVSLLIDRLDHTCGTRRAPVLRELCALLDEHYDREDREVLPLIRAHVPAAEWNEASRQVVEDYDRAVWSLYCWPCLF